MVYSSRFVVSVVLNGHILKEKPNGVVAIPFGSEYSLRFRNKHARRALVKFFIDGENVSGGGYVIDANSSIEIKRHAHKDVAFKFVSLDSEEAHEFGKNGPNDDGTKGLIEARFYLEKEYKYYPQPWYPQKLWNEWKTQPDWPDLSNPYVPPKNPTWTVDQTWTYTGNETRGLASFGGTQSSAIPMSDTKTAATFTVPAQNLQEGCTVEGNKSGQNFTSVYFDSESDYVGLMITLKGFNPEQNPIKVESKQEYCTNCGAKRGRKTDNFCGVCGTKF